MAIADEDIVREFFELNGLFALQKCKYQVQSRKKRAEEEIDLFLINPRAGAAVGAESAGASGAFAISAASDFARIKYAVVSIRPWHTSLFTPAMIKNSADAFNFLKKPAQKKAREVFGLPENSEEKISHILALSGFAAAPKLRREAFEILKAAGVSAVVTYPTMLSRLIDAVEPNNNYAKSELMQTLRILKNYGMLRSAQLELFRTQK